MEKVTVEQKPEGSESWPCKYLAEERPRRRGIASAKALRRSMPGIFEEKQESQCGFGSSRFCGGNQVCAFGHVEFQMSGRQVMLT